MTVSIKMGAIAITPSGKKRFDFCSTAWLKGYAVSLFVDVWWLLSHPLEFFLLQSAAKFSKESSSLEGI